ncbi:hypothetical protein ACLOJK_009904 [Asimina triloba]
MVSTCKCIAAQNPEGMLITLVATEEWLAILASDPPALPPNIQLRPIPNVLPSETIRGNDWPGFFEAVFTKMEAPVARLLEELEEKPAGCVVADAMLLPWVVALGKSRSIPVVSLWPMSSAVLLPLFDYTGDDDPIDVKDWKGFDVARRVIDAVSWVPKTECLLIASIHELEPHATDAIKAHLQLPVYTVGPCIPYLSSNDRPTTPTGPTNVDYYCNWLDSKPRDSVLFVSLGSHWVVSEAQTDEIASGLRASGAHFLWSARSNGQVCGDKGLIVPWCDQLRVLRHPSIGAFLTHCGWNSTMESVFAGVVMIAFPIATDQPYNAKLIVEDWKVGVGLRREEGSEGVVKSEEIAGAVKRVMDLGGDESKEMRSNAERLQEAFKRAIEVGGSSHSNINAFVKRVLHRRDVDG